MVRARYFIIAQLSVRVKSPSTMHGADEKGLIFKYSGVLC
jgi:hypothetical protein